jgi:hypothetical protein
MNQTIYSDTITHTCGRFWPEVVAGLASSSICALLDFRSFRQIFSRQIMIRTILVICTLIWGGPATAGAWDTGPFDNDDALDWVWELSESDDLSIIKSTLNSAASSSGYLEAPTASMAIAAAEVVAALRGNSRPDLPDEVSEWVDDHKLSVGDDLLKIARAAIENTKNTESSELAQLWMDSEELMDSWLKNVDDLLKRLQ